MLDLSLLQSVLIIVGFFFLHWYSSLFFQSFFYHRYAAHQQFTMNKFWERVFYFLGYISQGSSYLEPKGYAVMHRLHHAHTDTEHDPHSPSFSKNLWDMMMQTKRYYQSINNDKTFVEIAEKFYKDIPEWKWVNRLGDNWGSRIGWGAFYVIFYVVFATKWWMFALVPIHFVMGPFHGAVINWFAHKIGYINYRMRNTSKNILNLDFLMWGEGLHNNHHRKPYSANFAQKWFEFDPMYPVIKVFHWLHIIRLKPVTVNSDY
jgi:stearoyl-CoA desaturase (delta-9 desaturase)